MESDCEVDRLSNLPDALIHKILSYLSILYSIRLSVLSSRLRFIRTSAPSLNFSYDDRLRLSSRYHEFFNDVLSARNNKIDVSSVSLHLPCLKDPELYRLLEYAFSHNVQQLFISSSAEIHFSPSQLSCNSLKHLTLFHTTIHCWTAPAAWDLPALTTLHLRDVSFYYCFYILAMCQNLKNLTLEECQVFECKDPDGFSIGGRCTISNSQLLSLTLKKVEWGVDFVYVDTPQLKNLIFVDTPQPGFRISEFSGELTISAPGLTYLRIKGSYFPKLSLDGFPSLDKVDLCISDPQKTNVHRIFDLFQRLHSVKSLALSLEIVELLSTSEKVISNQFSPFPNLKSLKIYPSKGLNKALHDYSWDLKEKRLKSTLEIFETQPDEEQEAMKIKLSTEVTNYFLGSSSNANFKMVSHEEARAIKITKLAYRLMAASWEILEKIEAYTDTKRADAEWKKTLDDDSCREYFVIQIGPPGKTEEIFFILQNTKLLLTKVIESKRVEMEACYSRLYAKTTTIMNKMMVDMKNQCDMQQRICSGRLNEIALSS